MEACTLETNNLLILFSYGCSVGIILIAMSQLITLETWYWIKKEELGRLIFAIILFIINGIIAIVANVAFSIFASALFIIIYIYIIGYITIPIIIRDRENSRKRMK